MAGYLQGNDPIWDNYAYLHHITPIFHWTMMMGGRWRKGSDCGRKCFLRSVWEDKNIEHCLIFCFHVDEWNQCDSIHVHSHSTCKVVFGPGILAVHLVQYPYTSTNTGFHRWLQSKTTTINTGWNKTFERDLEVILSYQEVYVLGCPWYLADGL